MSKGSYAEIVHPPLNRKRQGSLRRIVMGTLLSVTQQCVVTKGSRKGLLALVNRQISRAERRKSLPSTL